MNVTTLLTVVLGPAFLSLSSLAEENAQPFDVELLAGPPPADRVIVGRLEPVGNDPQGRPAFEVRDRQFGFRLPQAAFIGPETTLTWSWRKPEGRVCILQLGLLNPETGVRRYLGYGAGAWAEPPSADPTVEVFISDTPPREWTTVTRPLASDIKTALGWDTASITEVYLSPWDGTPGRFAGAALRGLFRENVVALRKDRELEVLSGIGRGEYAPPRLRRLDEPRELRYDSHFEELAPGRNSAANEWSAFGARGDNAFNCMGRDLRVRYPAFDLVFRLLGAEGHEVVPGDLESFRLGLVRGNLPAIWGSWEHGGLRYQVSVMAVPVDERAAYDLYRLEVHNPTAEPRASRLAAGLDGPPDLRLQEDVVRGLGDVPFLLTDQPESVHLLTREWGLCDKRAKSYRCAGGPGPTEPAIASTRIGLDGLPVVYRFRAEPGRAYTVCLAASPHLSHLLPQPREVGDLVFRYQVEGAAPQTLDWVEYARLHSRPLFLEFQGARDADDDGYIQVTAGCDPGSRLRHTRLSAVYVFPDSVRNPEPEMVCSGALNGQCLLHLDVGATPECDWANQLYDMSDVGLCRLSLAYGGTLAAGEKRIFWLKVPPIHRRQPVSMGSISHAFLQVLPGEAAPPFGPTEIARLRAADPEEEWQRVIAEWDRFFAGCARIETPDPVLADLYLSRLATRAIHDVRIADHVWFNTCSPWFYYDFAYRDQAYVVYAYDLAGRHDLAERLLRVYCMDSKDVPPGPIAFGEQPLQLGMHPDGLWLTRAGQYDAQGQNLWCLVEHYRLSGDRDWLEKTAYPYIRRGAQWIVDVRQRHLREIGDPDDPRYGLLPPGAMEVAAVTRGMHHYYMDAWAVLGLNQAAEAAQALGQTEDRERFAREAADLRACLLRSMRHTFRRTGLYEGFLWYGAELEGDGMYGAWGHTPLLWPTRALDPHDPLLTATWRKLERQARESGGGVFSEGTGGCWPYIGVDWAIGYLLRGEPERTLDYFCAFTDTAGLTYSWGEGYDNGRNLAAGDQPHFWADAQWINLFRHLFVLEDGTTLRLTPATLRRWQESQRPLRLTNLPTAFGDLDLSVQGDGRRIEYTFRLIPKGDQARRPLDRIIIDARTPGGRPLTEVRLDGEPLDSFFGETIILPRPERGKAYRLQLRLAPE